MAWGSFELTQRYHGMCGGCVIWPSLCLPYRIKEPSGNSGSNATQQIQIPSSTIGIPYRLMRIYHNICENISIIHSACVTCSKLHSAPWRSSDQSLILVVESQNTQSKGPIRPFLPGLLSGGQYGTAGSVSSDIWHLIHPGSAVCFVVIPNTGHRGVRTMTTNTLTSLPASGYPRPLPLPSGIMLMMKKIKAICFGFVLGFCFFLIRFKMACSCR